MVEKGKKKGMRARGREKEGEGKKERRIKREGGR